jgi:hypothetical protein
MENGMMNKWQEPASRLDLSIEKFVRLKLRHTSVLTFGHVQSYFLTLIVGCLISSVAFFVELMIFYMRRQSAGESTVELETSSTQIDTSVDSM